MTSATAKLSGKYIVLTDGGAIGIGATARDALAFARKAGFDPSGWHVAPATQSAANAFYANALGPLQLQPAEFPDKSWSDAIFSADEFRQATKDWSINAQRDQQTGRPYWKLRT